MWCMGRERVKAFWHLAAYAASGSCWFMAVRADHFCSTFLQPTRHFGPWSHPPSSAVASPSPPASWEHNTSHCLPGGTAVAASLFELNNRSDVNHSLDIKIAGTCFSHAGQGWAGALLPPVPAPGLAWTRVVWWGFLRLLEVEWPQLCGKASTAPWQGCWHDFCKINKIPMLCHPGTTSIFYLLSRVLFC